jgi:ParB/RepB/Spo0J family partition protein
MSQVIDQPVTREQHAVPLSRLHPRPDFNPRSARDQEKFAQLVASVKLKGVLQPILVAPHPEIEGEYLIVDGESRYLAAADAGIVEVPCIIDVPDAATGGLDDALIANMVRADLTPLDEARGFKRLKDTGLNVKGIAERLSRPQKFVRDRLQLLSLPEEVQEQVEAGSVPLAAGAALAKLAGIHAELPTIAVAKVQNAPDDRRRSFHQPTWTDLVEDPIGVVLAGGYDVELPSDVYVGGGEFALECFTLSEQAQSDLDELLEIAVEAERDDVRVIFDRALVEQAASLKATHDGNGGQVLVVGQDVADQLAGDAIAAMLRDAQENEKEALVRLRRDAAEQAKAKSSGVPDPEAQRRAEGEQQREQEKAARRKALAHNEALGTAVLTGMPKVKIDVRVLKILAAINFGGDLNDIAARGARYCLPFDCWKRKRELPDSGVVKIEIVETTHCTAPARIWLEGARGQADYAGRLLSLAVLARYADQVALPRSRRAHYELHAGRDLPWSNEVVDLLDEIAGELLPEHLTAHVVAPKRAERVELDAARAVLDRALDDPAALSEDEREAAIDAAGVLLDEDYDEVVEQLTARTEESPADDAVVAA